MESNFYEERELINPVYFNMTMSFGFNLNPINNQKFSAIPIDPSALNSPELKKIKLSSEELDKFIGQHKYEVCETKPCQILTTKEMTEHEYYAESFVQALKELNNPGTSSSEDVYINADGLSERNGGTVKEDPKTVVEPMDGQEQTKLERRRQRNRLAAARCRKRKLEKIEQLEEKVKSLKMENAELSLAVDRLKAQVDRLKETMMAHVHAGCTIVSY